MLNILVTGANGQLGSELRALSSNYRYRFFFTDSNELDISERLAIEGFCKKNKINTIINCAAYTAVDKAEEDEVNANKVNHLAVRYLAEIAKKENIMLMHISTDYVFDGTSHRPYNETDSVNPQGVYGQTKLDGENTLLQINPKNSMLIRTSWVYSSFGTNFVKTMLKLGEEREELGVIFDQIGTPTYARDLAKTILDIIPKVSNNTTEIFHYSNEGVCSWYDFAKAIFELNKIDCRINPIESKVYPTPAKRPHYSLLNKEKIKNEYNITIPYWRDSLKQCLKNIGEEQ